MNSEAIENAQPYWDFCELPDVKEYLEQLNAGLIHPIEYAQKILADAERLNLLPKAKVDSRLKMTPEHYEQLKVAMLALDKEMLNRGIDLDKRSRDYKEVNLSPKRFRWDMLRNSGLRPGDSVGMRTEWQVYDYLNDTHIDSALKQFFREQNLAWAAGD